MWYGERDENDPRRGLLERGKNDYVSIEVKRIKVRISFVQQAIDQCRRYNDEHSVQKWSAELDDLLLQLDKQNRRKSDLSECASSSESLLLESVTKERSVVELKEAIVKRRRVRKPSNIEVLQSLKEQLQR